jgi:hypothetical protein
MEIAEWVCVCLEAEMGEETGGLLCKSRRHTECCDRSVD